MVKTIILNGSETKVDGLGDRNTMIVNNGSGPIYASANPGVEAFADNVLTIKAGQRDIIPETYGTVYLLGSGSVECRGVRYVNFNQPSSQGEGSSSGGGDYTLPPATTATLGGVIIGEGIEVTSSGEISVKRSEDPDNPNDIVATEEETNEMLDEVFGLSVMPFVEGIQAIFRWQDADQNGETWPNFLDKNNFISKESIPFSKDDINQAVHFSNGCSGEYNMENEPNIIYLVGFVLNGGSSTISLIQKGLTGKANNNNYSYFGFDSNSNQGIRFNYNFAYGSAIPSKVPRSTRQLLAVSRDDRGIAQVYLNGELLGNPVTAPIGQYNGRMFFHEGFVEPNNVIENSGDAYISYAAIGTGHHTKYQVQKNSEWLMKQYNIGG